MDINDYFDSICSENLKTDVSNFIEKIEKTTEFRRHVIISQLLSPDNNTKLEQARRCFNLIK